jgi:hypothetical protein
MREIVSGEVDDRRRELAQVFRLARYWGRGRRLQKIGRSLRTLRPDALSVEIDVLAIDEQFGLATPRSERAQLSRAHGANTLHTS